MRGKFDVEVWSLKLKFVNCQSMRVPGVTVWEYSISKFNCYSKRVNSWDVICSFGCVLYVCSDVYRKTKRYGSNKYIIHDYERMMHKSTVLL